jgi:uncharacterized protein YjbJ (UPF0337 family)
MAGKSEELKGSVKEAVGAARGDDKQRREGQKDQVVGKLKQAGEEIKDAAGKAADAVRRR